MIVQESNQSFKTISDPILASKHPIAPSRPLYLGLTIALLIITVWAISLVYFLTWNLNQATIWTIIPAIFLQTFLYTGLFITAHDAMHGSICPQYPRLNHALGRLCVELYAVFSYQKLRQKHYQHHRYPASEKDPDFHDNQGNDQFWAWYIYFMKNYWDWRCWFGLTALFIVARYVCQFSQANLWLFWVIPALLSSLQLFYFGTYLPHREPKVGYQEPHRAQSVDLPWILSFLSCYHFGYHQEHHEFPHVPWWQLPMIHDRKQQEKLLIE